MSDENNDINQRCTAALRALEAAKVIRPGWVVGRKTPAFIACWSGFAGEHPNEDRQWCSGVNPEDPGSEYSTLGDWVDLVELDLSDPITAASLIVLVREAWAAHAHCVRTTGGVWGVWVFDDSYGPARSSHRVSLEDTEVEACVAALEAKAREVAP